LEAKGVKAFGDLEEGMYRKPSGEWAVDALEEDLAVSAAAPIRNRFVTVNPVNQAASGRGRSGGERRSSAS